MIGPNDTEAAAEIAQNPIATPRFSGGNSREMIAIPNGCIIPAPIPCTIRAKINASSFPESPHKSEPKVKSNKPMKYMRL